MGRWMSPDWSEEPEPVPYADLIDPQSLNLYGYVRDNLMSRADADGHCCDSVFDGNSIVEEFRNDALQAKTDLLIGAGKSLVNGITSTINLLSSCTGGICVPGSGTNI